jgi:hypothetical protein
MAAKEFVFAAGSFHGVDTARILYLSTTDYVQHKHATGTAQANAFYGMMDGYLARLDAAGAAIALTADHGMNAKTDRRSAQVVYLRMCSITGPARAARVILPSPTRTVHHGALAPATIIFQAPTASGGGQRAAGHGARLDRRKGAGASSFRPTAWAISSPSPCATSSSAPAPRSTISPDWMRRSAPTAGSRSKPCRWCSADRWPVCRRRAG